jgi:hypothetical protein
MWLLPPGLAVGAVLAMLPVGVVVAAASAVVVGVAAAVGLVAAAPLVEVSGGQLRAGRAQIPVHLLRDARWVAGEEARQERGPRLDARAYLCIRGWVDPVVRVDLDDPEDPTPYWLVSSRRPEALVDALRAAEG